MKSSSATLIVEGDTAWLRDDSPITYTLWRRLATKGAESGSWILDPSAVPDAIWDDTPTVTVQGAICTLQAAAGSWQLPVQVAYAHMPPPTPPNETWLSGSELQAAWKPMLPVTGRDYSRPGLCAVELKVFCGSASVAATDGYRIGYWQGELPYPDGTLAWPADAARWLDKRRAWSWQLHDGKLWCIGSQGTWLLRAEPAIGFPDYRPYIVASLVEAASCTLYAKPLAAAVKNCTVGKAPKRIALDWGDGQLRLTGRDKGGATAAAATLAAETDGGATLLLDPTLLHPMLAALGRETCTLHSQGANRPLYISCGSWLMLQMVCVQ